MLTTTCNKLGSSQQSQPSGKLPPNLKCEVVNHQKLNNLTQSSERSQNTGYYLNTSPTVNHSGNLTRQLTAKTIHRDELHPLYYKINCNCPSKLGSNDRRMVVEWVGKAGKDGMIREGALSFPWRVRHICGTLESDLLSLYGEFYLNSFNLHHKDEALSLFILSFPAIRIHFRTSQHHRLSMNRF